ncbi:MAG: flavin reductase family protein [Spirochaetia bacterium]|nr:flavin reductase family protein [Spirochaetia bacterium]
MSYTTVPLKKAYKLINPGQMVLVSTVSEDKKFNIAPIAWTCPCEIDPPRVILCMDAGHKTFKDLKETGIFTVCIPHISQLKMVKQTGSVSGRDADKFRKFGIATVAGKRSLCRIPEGLIGYLECRVKNINDIEGTAVVVGDVVDAGADTKAFDGERLLAETKGGKAIHHLGGDNFITYADELL